MSTPGPGVYGGLSINVTANTVALVSEVRVAAEKAGAEAAAVISRSIGGALSAGGAGGGGALSQGIAKAAPSVRRAARDIGAAAAADMSSVLGQAITRQAGLSISTAMSKGFATAGPAVSRAARDAGITAASELGQGLTQSLRRVGPVMSTALNAALTGAMASAGRGALASFAGTFAKAGPAMAFPFARNLVPAGAAAGEESAVAFRRPWLAGIGRAAAEAAVVVRDALAAAGAKAGALASAGFKKSMTIASAAAGAGLAVAKGAALAIGGVSIAATILGVNAFKAAARVQAMNSALYAIGQQQHITRKQIDDTVRSIVGQNIMFDAAQNTVATFARSHLDLAKAVGLANVAQNLAVITNKNSSDVLNKLSYGILTLNTRVLRTAGVQIQVNQAEQDYAKNLGTTAAKLTPLQKEQAVLNAVLEQGKGIAGAYSSAMQDAGKVMNSLPRVFNTIAIGIGQQLLPLISPLIIGFYNMASAVAKNLVSGGKLAPIVKAIADVFRPLAGLIDSAFKALQRWVEQVKPAQIKAIADQIERFGPAIAAVAAASAVLTGGAAFAGLFRMMGMGAAFKGFGEAIGEVAGALGAESGGLAAALDVLTGPVGWAIGAFGALMALSPKFRTSIFDLAKTIGTTLYGAFRTVAGAIGPVLGPMINFFKVLGSDVGNILALLMPYLKAFVTILGRGFGEIVKALGPYFHAVAAQWKIMLDLIRPLWPFIKLLFEAIVAPALTVALAAVAGGFRLIAGGLNLISKPIDAVSSFMEKIAGKLGGLQTTGIKGASNLWGGFTSWLGRTTVGSWVKNTILDPIAGALGPPGGLKDTGKTAGQGLTDGLGSGLWYPSGDVSTWSKKNLSDPLSVRLSQRGPESLWGAGERGGESLVAGVGVGVQTGRAKLNIPALLTPGMPQAPAGPAVPSIGPSLSQKAFGDQGTASGTSFWSNFWSSLKTSPGLTGALASEFDYIANFGSTRFAQRWRKNWDQMLSGMQTAWGKTVNYLSTQGGDWVSTTSKLFRGIRTGWNSTISYLTTQGGQWVSATSELFRGIRTGWDTAISGLSGPWHSFTSYMGTQFKDWGKSWGLLWHGIGGDAIDGFFKGIGDKIAGISTWVNKHIIQPVVHWVKYWFGESSPSTVFAAIGGDLITGLFNGILTALGDIKNWIHKHIITPIQNGFSGLGDWFRREGSGLISRLQNGLHEAPTTIKNWIHRNIVTPIQDGFQGFGNWMQRLGRGALNLFQSGLSLLGTSVKSLQNWVRQHLLSPIEKAIFAVFNMGSPSKRMEALGRNVSLGFMSGIFKGAKNITGFVNKVFGGVPQALAAFVARGMIKVGLLPQGAINALRALQGSSGWAGKAARAITGITGGGAIEGLVGPAIPAAASNWFTNLKTVAQYMTAFGWSPAAAAGFAGNVYRESGGNPLAQGSGGRGLIGWTPASTLPNYAFVPGDPAGSLAAQLPLIVQYFARNLTATQKKFINSLSSAGKAALAIMNWGERPYGSTPNNPLGYGYGTAGGAIRAAMAQQVYNALYAWFKRMRLLAAGGVITEPVFGVGARSGRPYAIAERGPEMVSPLTSWAEAVAAHKPYRAGQTTINVYPQKGQSETEIAAAVSRRLAWAAASGAGR